MKGEQSTPPHEHREERERSPHSVRDFILNTFKKDLDVQILTFHPRFSKDAEMLADAFRHEVVDLLQPAAEQLLLNDSQMWYVRSLLSSAFGFRLQLQANHFSGKPSTHVDQERIIAVATYINSLVAIGRH
jgi:hypothetical protein